MLNGNYVNCLKKNQTIQVSSDFSINAPIIRTGGIPHFFYKCYFFCLYSDCQATISITDLHNVNLHGVTLLSEDDVHNVIAKEKKRENSENIGF